MMKRKAIIFGVGLDIGKSIATKLDDIGFDLVLVGRNREKIDLISTALKNRHESYIIDLTDHKQLKEMVDSMKDGELPDTVITNLVLDYPISKIIEQSEDLLAGRFANILTHLLSLAPKLIEFQRSIGFGRWIGISSYSEAISTPGMCQYNFQKSLLKQFIFTLAAEEGRWGVTGNIVSPGIINTSRMVNKYSDEKIVLLSGQNVLKRAGNPDDVAAAVAFLASNDSSFISGQELAVNGGANLGWQFLRSNK